MAIDTATRQDRDGMSAGWCPDCDLPSAVVDQRDGSGSWAECLECGAGWVDRDDRSEQSPPQRQVQRRAA